MASYLPDGVFGYFLGSTPSEEEAKASPFETEREEWTVGGAKHTLPVLKYKNGMVKAGENIAANKLVTRLVGAPITRVGSALVQYRKGSKALIVNVSHTLAFFIGSRNYALPKNAKRKHSCGALIRTTPKEEKSNVKIITIKLNPSEAATEKRRWSEGFFKRPEAIAVTDCKEVLAVQATKDIGKDTELLLFVGAKEEETESETEEEEPEGEAINDVFNV